MNDLKTAIIPDKGAATRLIALLEEAHRICADHRWPYMLGAVAITPDETLFHLSGRVDMTDEGVRGLLASTGEDGICLAAIAKAQYDASAKWNAATAEPEEKEIPHVD